MKRFSFLRRGLWSLLSLCLMALLVFALTYLYVESFLPNVETLKTIQLQVPLRIYSSDHQLIAEYGEKRRIPVTIDEIPQPLIHALLDTEDQRYFEHPGVDIFGLGRAVIQLVRTGKKAQGGSTITMQVARNFFLDRKKTYGRKINEILLAIKIDRTLSKGKILELYLNKIYLGQRAYGVAAAAAVYYGKTLKELTLAQMAMLAGLPKAPSKINPLKNPNYALKRRNHVLSRMLEEGHVDQASYQTAINAPLTASYHGNKISLEAPYVAEMIRQTLVERLGKEAYTKGYQVSTTIDSHMQNAANKALRNGLLAYTHRHGYRGPSKNLGFPDSETLQTWREQLQAHPAVNGIQSAAITEVGEYTAKALLHDGQIIDIPWAGISWAQKQLKNGRIGFSPQQSSDVLQLGDVVRVQQVQENQWRITQLPEVEGALVALRPQDGAIQALTGGFSFKTSKFNRATQAARQPGSAFKPFIYTAALNKGFTLASIINDAPIVLEDPSQTTVWRPQNDSRKFYGPTRLRSGLTHSRNLVSIRLLDTVGIPYTLKILKTFGFDVEQMPATLSLALGTLDLTPLQLTSSFAIFANGGFKISPYLISSITTTNGETIFQATPQFACPDCQNPSQNDALNIPEEQRAPQVISSQIAYLMTLALKSTIQQGTGRDARVLNRHDLAGKTGTTNDQIDAWFTGYNSTLVATTWVGFDQPKSLYEYGRQAALPIWIEFMKSALKGKPESSMMEPPGLITVRIDPKTGRRAANNLPHSVFETFREEYAPPLSMAATQADQQENNDDTAEDDEHLF